MADELKITITAVDGASKVFDAVVDAAEEFKPAIDKATDGARKFTPAAEEAVDSAADLRPALDGATSSARKFAPAVDSAVDAVKPLDRELDEAGKSAKEAGASIEKSGRSFKDYEATVKQVATGLGLLGTAFTMYSQQARDHELTVRAIGRVYGEAADSYVQFANQIQSTTIFSNDEALEAARIMGTLRENYDLTDQQIQQLIATSADLAAMHGFTLTDAAMRVQSAIRGEAESAEMLGLTMNQAAIDTNNLTLSMSQGEAAQFRYNALMEQSASSVGFAAEAAEGAAGKTQQLANRAQDAAMAFVQFTGPVGQVASGLTAFGAEAGFAVAGMAAMAPAAGKAALAIKGLSMTTLGPAGLVLGLGAATIAAWKYFDSLGDDGIAGRMEAAATAGDTLAASISRVSHEMSTATLGLNLFGDLDTLTGQALNDIQRLEELAEKWAEVAATGARPTGPVTIPGGDFEKASAEWDELIALVQKYGNVTGETLAEVSTAYNEIITNTLPGHEAALQTAMNIMDDFQAGHITLEELRDRLNGVIADLPNYAEQALEAAAANEAIASSATSASDALNTFASAQIAANAEFRQWLELHGLAQQYDQERSNAPTIGSEAQVQWLANYSQGMDLAALSAAGFDGAINAVIKTQPNFITSMGESERAVVTFTQTLSDGKPEIEAMEEAYRELFTSVAEGAASMNANSVLGGGFSAIVGGAQGMGRMAEQTAEWAGSLAHGITGQTKLDQLLLKGAISGKTYRDGLEANHRIQEANNEVQEDVLRIQAKQLPIMAQMAEEQAAYVDSIADLPAAQQTAALGFMDTAKASDAMALAQLAAASSTDAMQASTSAMITQMALADPVLKAMLIDMGLISEGADGTITVNYGDAESANDILSALNTTLTDLHAWLQQQFNVTVTADDQATGPLSLIEQALANLDGKSATVYVNTTGASIGLLSETARDGGVVGYANGGMVMAQLAEVGPELVRLANGGVAIAPTNGLYMVERGSNVMPAEASRAEMRRHAQPGGDTYIYSGQVTQRITYEESSFARRRAGIAGQRR